MGGLVLNKKYILNFTPTGMIPTKDMTKYVPIGVDEIVEQVLEVADLGISIVHIHAREDTTGSPSYKKEIYADIIRGIRKHNKELVLGVSTSGRDFNEFEKRSDCLNLMGEIKPEMGSLTLSSLNFNKQASINSPEIIQQLATKMKERGIKPELEVFDLGMINYAKYLIRKGLITPPYYFNIILGNIACAQADMLHLGLMIRELPENSVWSVGAVGDPQLKMNIMAIIAGGGVRVGLEDNIWFDLERTKLATNYELVERVVNMARGLGCIPYTPREAKSILGI